MTAAPARRPLAGTRTWAFAEMEWTGFGPGRPVLIEVYRAKSRAGGEAGKWKRERYLVGEVPPGAGGRRVVAGCRVFKVVKAGGERWHHVAVGPDVSECSCEGGVYRNTAKADARDLGQYGDTAQCLHEKAVLALVAAGAFGATASSSGGPCRGASAGVGVG